MKWYKIAGALLFLALLLFIGLVGYVDYNQQRLLTSLKAEINKNIKGQFTADKISVTIFREFPNISVTLQNGVIKDSFDNQVIFHAGKIYCRLNALNLLREKIEVRSIIIENSDVFLAQDSAGQLNANIFRFKNSEPSVSTNVNFNLEQLKILNFKVSFNDEKRDKHISMLARDLVGNITHPDSSFHIALQGFIHTDSMVFKKDKGSFLVDREADVKMKLLFDPVQMKLSILKSPVVVDEQKYMMEGYFAFASKPALMWLSITDTKVNFNKARAVLSTQIQEKMKDVDVQSPVDVRLLIKGTIEPDFPPQVDASFRIHNGTIKYYGVEISEMNMDGLFMNHINPHERNEDFNSELLFDIPGAKVNGVPISIHVTVADLNELHVAMTASASTPLTALNQTIGSDTSQYQFTGGHASLQVSYTGTIYYYMDSIKRKFDDSLNGSLNISAGNFEYSKRDLHITDINTHVTFTNNLIDLGHTNCALNGNIINLAGTVTSIRRMVTGNVEKMIGNLQVQTDKFDLTKVLVVNKGFKPVTPAPKVSEGDIAKVTKTINQITDMLTLNLDVKCKNFIFRKINATDVTGLISASSHGMQLQNFNLNICKGHLTAAGALTSGPEHDRLEAHANIKNVEVKDFLSSMENFNQTTIKDENVSGRLNAQVDFSSPLDSKYNVLADSMDGNLHFSLQDGELTNFQPMVEVGKKIFKNRDFKNISFAEIKDSITIQGKTLTLKKLEIASSIMRLYIQGKFTFDGLCDLNIQVPLSNLRRQDLNYEPENIGLYGKAGASIFLRVHGVGDSIKITLDPSARQKMKKAI